MTLVDASRWIEVFRERDPLRLEELVDFEEIVTCLPVMQEVLQGFREERHWRIAREALFALPMVESLMEAAVYLEAAALYRAARRGGLTVRSSIDCQIAACARHHDLEVLHPDRDFTALSRVTALRSKEG